MKIGIIHKKGFSLVELMIVVGIIGILASMSVQGFKKFSVRGMQMEARLNLSAFYLVSEVYFNETGTYYVSSITLMNSNWPATSPCVNPNPMNFQIAGCVKSRYYIQPTTLAPIMAVALERGSTSIAPYDRAIFSGCDFLTRDSFVLYTDKRIVHDTAAEDNCL